MRRMVILFVSLVAFLAWIHLSATKPNVPQIRVPAPAENQSLRDLIPASAILAVEVRGLERRWDELRGTCSLAGFEDAIFACFEVGPELVPMLAGNRAILFVAPLDRHPWVAPIAVFQPEALDQAQEMLKGIDGVSWRRRNGLLWVGPAGEEGLLEHFSEPQNASLRDIIPMEEDESALPPGGLIRGWVNPGACVELLRDSRMDTYPLPLRWAAAAVRAELAAARVVEFRRDFAGGELVADGLITYDPIRLPPEIMRILDPSASPVSLPGEFPSNTVAVMAFRPEAQAWTPWLRYLAASDPRGPLRNLGFWLDEFQQRYRRNLERDLFEAIGDHGWLLAVNLIDTGSPGIAVVVETHPRRAAQDTLKDLISWMGEHVMLESFGTIRPRLWHEELGGRATGGVTLRTPFFQVPGPNFQLVDRYLVVASEPESMQAARAWIEILKRSRVGGKQTSSSLPIHGSVLVQGAELAKWVRANSAQRPDAFGGCLLDAMIGLVSDLEAFRMDMRYEQCGIRFHGRVRFAGRMQVGSGHRVMSRQKGPPSQRESLLSLVSSSSRTALTWGVPAAWIRELTVLRPCL